MPSEWMATQESSSLWAPVCTIAQSINQYFSHNHDRSHLPHTHMWLKKELASGYVIHIEDNGQMTNSNFYFMSHFGHATFTQVHHIVPSQHHKIPIHVKHISNPIYLPCTPMKHDLFLNWYINTFLKNIFIFCYQITKERTLNFWIDFSQETSALIF